MREVTLAILTFAVAAIGAALLVGGIVWLASESTCASYTRAEYQRNEAPEYCYDR